MKYLPLIWATLRRKPLRTGLTVLSVTIAFILFGLSAGMAVRFQQATDMALSGHTSTRASTAGNTMVLGAEGMAALGLVMILFLTANAIAQSVRSRIQELAVLKAIGFTNRGIIALVFAEAAIPCLLGTACGLLLANIFCLLLPRLLPPGVNFPAPDITPMIVMWGFAASIAVAFFSTALPALRIARLNVATALTKG